MKYINQAVIGLGLTILVGGCHELSGANAKKGARQYAKEMQLKNPRISCVMADSDGDGYVSCAIRYDENGGSKTDKVLCSAWSHLNVGCKLPDIQMR